MARSVPFLKFLLLFIIFCRNFAIILPPHARVNYKCYISQAKPHSLIEAYWMGAHWALPWSMSQEQEKPSIDNKGIQRHWCTDSGVAGVVLASFQAPTSYASLQFLWLRNFKMRVNIPLAARIRTDEGEEHVLPATTQASHGAVLVQGDLLYFHSFNDRTKDEYTFPHLSIIQFDEYAPKPLDRLWRYLVRGLRLVQYDEKWSWMPLATLLYHSGQSSITVSVALTRGTDDYSLDDVVTLAGPGAEVVVRIFTGTHVTSSSHSIGREFVTAPGYACRASLTGNTPLCYEVKPGRYTWLGHDVKPMTMAFRSLSLSGMRSFRLPLRLWTWNTSIAAAHPYPILTSTAAAPLIAMREREAVGVFVAENTSCPSGLHVALCTWGVDEPTVTPRCIYLMCSWTQQFPETFAGEVPFEALAVKWAGPWSESFELYVASDIAKGEYVGPVQSVDGCRPGFFFEDSGCHPCPESKVCPGALDEPVNCALRLGRGASECKPCEGASAWWDGACVQCAEAPPKMECVTRHFDGETYHAFAGVFSVDVTVISVAIATVVLIIAISFATTVFIRKKYAHLRYEEVGSST